LCLDAIIISDSGADSLSGSNPLRLTLNGRVGNIQLIRNYAINKGRIVTPIVGDTRMSWSSAPKLNGIYLFDYLNKRGFQVELIQNYSEEQNFFRELLKSPPRAIVISTTFMPGKRVLRKVVDDVRHLAPDVYIIAGGPLVYMSYLILQRSKEPEYLSASAKDDFLFLDSDDDPSVDLYIVSQRGEDVLSEALGRLRRGQDFKELPNSACLTNKTYHFSRRTDGTTSPDMSAINWESLPKRVFDSGVVPLQASSGCPYQCAFCNFVKDRRMICTKPLDQLIEELKAVSRLGARYVWFVDDNFRLGKPDLDSVCRRFIDEKFDVRWMTFIRASTLMKADPQLLREAGCIELQLGIESADPRILANMNKKASPELYEAVLKKFLAAGINCSCYFIIGFPGETPDSLKRTRDFIRRHQSADSGGILTCSLFPFILSPLSPIYEPAKRKAYELSGYMHNWQHATMNSKQARDHVIQEFLAMDNSGPIYRGDNQDMLSAIGSEGRNRFEALRQKHAKSAIRGSLNEEEVVKDFSFLAPIVEKNTQP